jgi:UBA-like domain/Thioredoxin-like
LVDGFFERFTAQVRPVFVPRGLLLHATSLKENMDQSDSLVNFISMTDADPAIAKAFLQASGWDVQAAVTSFFDSGGVPPSTSSSSSSSSSRGYGGGGSGGGYGYDEEGVRAAMQDKVEQLVGGADNRGYYSTGGFAQQRAAIPQVPAAFRNFEQEQKALASKGKGGKGGGAKGLASLLRPPTELLHHGSWEEFRGAGKKEKKWLLVNIQDDKDFDSFRLNRDTWSDETLQEVVRAGFVFWQQHRELEAGSASAATAMAGAGMHAALMAAMGGAGGGRSHVTEQGTVMIPNPAAKAFIDRYQLETFNGGYYPTICIVDPRSQELVFSYTGFISAGALTDKLMDFCTKYSLDEL